MVVLEQALSKYYEEIDMVTTPDGKPVAMVHCNNCTSDLNAWVGLFGEAMEAFGVKPDMDTLYGTLYRKALEGDADCGGLLAYQLFFRARVLPDLKRDVRCLSADRTASSACKLYAVL